MFVFNNTSINAVTVLNFYEEFDVLKTTTTPDNGKKDFRFNIAFNIFDEEGPNLIPGIEKFGKFVLTEQIWNYVPDS